MNGLGLLASGTWDFVTPTFFWFLPVACLCLTWSFVQKLKHQWRRQHWGVVSTTIVLVLPTTWAFYVIDMNGSVPFLFLVIWGISFVCMPKGTFWIHLSALCTAAMALGGRYIYSLPREHWGQSEPTFYYVYLAALFVLWLGNLWMSFAGPAKQPVDIETQDGAAENAIKKNEPKDLS